MTKPRNPDARNRAALPLTILVLLFALPAVAQQTITVDVGASVSSWSPAERAGARPVPLRTVAGSPVATTRGAIASIGAPGSWPGHRPGEPPAIRSNTAPASRTSEATVEPQFGTGSAVWYSYPSPYTLEIPLFGYFAGPTFPLTALGKLFFQDGQGNGFACSGQSVTSSGAWGAGNGQTVMTAGHCCSDGQGGFYNNIQFEPGHLNGVAPQGAWSAGRISVFQSYHEQSDLSRDVCVLQMNNQNGQTINAAVGALGYAFNQPLPQHFHATGWPAEPPFGGGLLFINMAGSAETDTTQGALLTHGIGNVLTGGSSGGAWIVGYHMFSGANQINGLNSYRYTTPARPLQMFSPYFDDQVIDSLLQPAATAPPLP